jgi:hypothetical protein
LIIGEATVRRSSLLAALAAGLLVGTAPAVAAAGTASSVPGQAVAGDDTGTVCKATEKTVNGGMTTFVADMRRISAMAQSGDLAGAQTTAKHAGATLAGIAKQLRVNAKSANDANVKKTVGQLAKEFEHLGGQVANLTTGPHGLDTSRLVQLANQMAALCGVKVPGVPTGAPPGGMPSDVPSGGSSPTIGG